MIEEKPNEFPCLSQKIKANQSKVSCPNKLTKTNLDQRFYIESTIFKSPQVKKKYSRDVKEVTMPLKVISHENGREKAGSMV